ncbi:hypothetical protein AAY473_033861 [Plecturocebus cupreus]
MVGFRFTATSASRVKSLLALVSMPS